MTKLCEAIIITSKEWLNRARRIDNEINALQQAQQNAWARVVSITAAPSGVSVSGTKDPHKFDRYVELQDKINRRIDELHAVKLEILAVIEQVDDTVLRTLLLERYINCKTWERIAVDTHYSYAAVVQRQHPRALEAVRKVIANKCI